MQFLDTCAKLHVEKAGPILTNTHLFIYCELIYPPNSFADFLFKRSIVRAAAEAVSHWLPTAGARVRFRVKSCGKSGTGGGFSWYIRFPYH
jgi:hypothetical protein